MFPHFPRAEGHSAGVSFSAFNSVAPIIDGAIGETEWASAARLDFDSSIKHFKGTFYVMNDDTNLYTAVKIADNTLTSRNIEIMFDNNHNGVIEAGEDAFQIGASTSPFDSFVETVSPDFLALGSDSDFGGTTDGTARATSDGSFNYFEFSHPLCAQDTAHDFCLSTGDTIGFNIQYGMGGPYDFWPQPPTRPLTDASGYGDISVATPPHPQPKIIQVLYPNSISPGESATITLVIENVGTNALEGDVQIAFPQNPDATVITSVSGNTSISPVVKHVGDMFAGCNYGGPGCTALYPAVVAVHQSWSTGLRIELNVTIKPVGTGEFVFEVKTTMPTQDYSSWFGAPLQSCSPCATDQQGEKVSRFEISLKLYKMTHSLSVGGRIITNPQINAPYTLNVNITNYDTVSHAYELDLTQPYAFLPNGHQLNKTNSEVGYVDWPFPVSCVLPFDKFDVSPATNGNELPAVIGNRVITVPPGETRTVPFSVTNSWNWIPQWDTEMTYCTVINALLSAGLGVTLSGVKELSVDFLMESASILNYIVPILNFQYQLSVNGNAEAPFGVNATTSPEKVSLWGESITSEVISGLLTGFAAAAVVASCVLPPLCIAAAIALATGEVVAILAYHDLYVAAHDPTSEFSTIYTPTPFTLLNGTLFASLPFVKSLDTKSQAVIQALATFESLNNATSISFTRYEGALLAGDSASAALQLQATRNYSKQRDQAWERFTVLLNDTLTTTSKNAGVDLLSLNETAFRLAQSQISQNGLPLIESVLLNETGLGFAIPSVLMSLLQTNATIIPDRSIIEGLETVHSAFINQTDTVERITPPRIDILSPKNDSFTSQKVSLVFTTNLPVTWTRYSLDGASNATISGNTTLTVPDEGHHLLVIYATSAFGHVGHSAMLNFTVDATPPVITSYQDDQSFTLGAEVPAVAQCSDALSGVDTCSLSVALLDTASVGAHSFTVTSTDKVGNIATITVHFSVHYNFTAISPQPSGKGTQVGRTVPMRFQLTDALGNFISTATARVWVDSQTNPGKSNGSANTGNYFRFDPSSNQYLFNLSTTGMTTGSHTVYITLGDGTIHTIVIGLTS